MSSPWDELLSRELNDKEFRDAYLTDQVRTGIAFQLRALREQADRKWSQSQLAERMGTHQPIVARLENPDYGRVTLTTLLEAASAFDVALLVQFVEWDDFLNRMHDISPNGLQKRSYSKSGKSQRKAEGQRSATRRGPSNIIRPDQFIPHGGSNAENSPPDQLTFGDFTKNTVETTGRVLLQSAATA